YFTSLSYTFLIYLYSHPHFLPSFPTRRSSDLADPRHRGLPARPPPSHRLVLDQRGADHRRGGPPDRLPGDRARHHRPDARRAAQDRKSTRLNSSHVKISYAVFCLKKKRKIQTI